MDEGRDVNVGWEVFQREAERVKIYTEMTEEGTARSKGNRKRERKKERMGRYATLPKVCGHPCLSFVFPALVPGTS